MIKNGQQVRIWEQAFIPCFKAICQKSLSKLEENQEKSQAGQPVSQPKFEQVPSEYKSRALTHHQLANFLTKKNHITKHCDCDELDDMLWTKFHNVQ